MGLQVDLNWTDLGWTVAAAVHLVCLVWLLRAVPRSALRDAFAALLATSGGTITFFLWWVEGGMRYGLVEPFDNAMMFASLLVFVTWLAIEKGWRLPRGLPWYAVAGMILLTAAYILRPDWRFAVGDNELAQAGPLFPITEGIELAANTAIATLFIAAAIRRDSMLLGMAGFGFACWAMLGGLHTIPQIASGQWTERIPDASPGDRPWVLLMVLVPAGTAIYMLAATAVIVARGRRNRTRRLVAVAVLGAAVFGSLMSAIAFTTGGAGAENPWAGAFRVVTGLSSLLIPLFSTLYMVSEANVARETRVWKAVRRSSVPAVMVAVFFLVSEGAQNLFSGALGPLVGLLATLPVVLLLVPIQRLGERIGHAMVPETQAKGASEKESLYERQVRYAWADGRIGATERERLVDLRRALGIAAERAEDIERRVVAGIARPAAT